MLARILRELRSRLRDDVTGRQVSQAKLYRLCQQEEGPPPDRSKPRTGVGFPAIHEDVRREKISEFETGKEPTPGQKRVMERVFHLPPGFLDRAFGSAEQFFTELQDTNDATFPGPVISYYSPTDAALRESKTVFQSRRRADKHLAGIRVLDENYQITPGHRPLLRRIQNLLKPAAVEENLRVVVLQGQAGVGKSQIIAEWWKRYGRATFHDHVFTLNCERKPGDQILRALSSHFLGGEPGRIEAAVQGIREASSPLIVLDGLVNEPPAVQGSPQSVLIAPTDADSVALSSVSALLVAMAEYGTAASVLLAVQTDRPDADALRILGKLHAGVQFLAVRVEPLNDDDGAFMLRHLGVREVADDDLRRISRNLMGLPISIEAAASYLVNTNPEDKEEFILQMNDLRCTRFASFERFFLEYISLLYRGPHDPEAHPHAF